MLKILTPVVALLALAACSPSGTSTTTSTSTSTEVTFPVAAASLSSSSMTASPSFDCAKTTDNVEAVICTNPQLAKLDGEMARVYDLVNRAADTDRTQLTRLQGGWMAQRDACSTTTDKTGCLVNAYAQRISDLRAGYPAARADADGPSIGPIGWTCPGSTGTMSSTFINVDPSLLYLTWGNKTVLLTQAMSASGARYTSSDGGYEFWNKGDETTFTAPGVTAVTCKKSS